MRESAGTIQRSKLVRSIQYWVPVVALGLFLLSGAGAAHATGYTSTDVPKDIPPGGSGSSTLEVPPGAPLVGDVDVTGIKIDDTGPAYLSATLKSPSGTVVTMWTNGCEGNLDEWNDGNTNFTLDDSASAQLKDNCPPNGGTYLPEEELASFIGQPSSGTWTFTVASSSQVDSGTLDAWGLDIDAPLAFTVNTSDDTDDGICNLTHCSLREAIDAANTNPGVDTIAFSIAGPVVHTISPSSPLPDVIDPVTIDGYTQPGASPNTLAVGDDAVLLIELDGTYAGAGTEGLNLASDSSTVRGLVINAFDGAALDLAAGSDNVVQGNFIGTNPSGAVAVPNGGNGVLIDGGTGNAIGGTPPAVRNVISGNGSDGILITGSSASGNTVQGNYLGTNAAGTGDLGNQGEGVLILGAPNNSVGGTGSGAGNVISGNDAGAGDSYGDGVQLKGADATGNVIQGNIIGLNAAGTAKIGNAYSGVFGWDGASDNTVGGTAAGARNVISGNAFFGVSFYQGADDNLIQGNYIGTNAAGTVSLGNGYGVSVSDAAGNTVGGTSTSARNVISGNSSGGGVTIGGSSASGNTVQGNYIGLNAAGTAAIANRGGVGVIGAPANTIGGTAAGAGNVISGNQFEGVFVFGPNANAVIQGNLIGTNPAGTAAIGNGFRGVFFQISSGNLLGGTSAAARNVISGNGHDGVEINGSDNTVQGNYIGTNATGSGFMANLGPGVLLFGGTNNAIGGTASGAGNLISGNTYGVQLSSGSNGNQVQGNFIGTNGAGTSSLGNTAQGILIDNGTGNVIGGTLSGARNVISGNNSDGIRISTSDASGNTVQGNYIGLNAAGTGDLGNRGDGVHVAAASNTLIGGTASGAGNVISGNDLSNSDSDGDGIEISGTGATGNLVQGNTIGLNAAGTVAIGNNADAVFVYDVAGNTVGGTDSGARNILSGNAQNGVEVYGPGAQNNLIKGNYIGTNAAGTAALGNGGGIHVAGQATGNTVGGTSAGAGNVVSGNALAGIDIFGAGTTGNTVQGNYVGLNTAGTAKIANGADGIIVWGAASDNLIGGTTAGARNVSSGNGLAGIAVGTGSNNNTIQGNYVGTNAAGIAAIANLRGIFVQASSGTLVGGTASGAGNLVSGNTDSGVLISEGGASGNTVQGNTIGLNAAGTAALPNTTGVYVNDVPGNTIGGTSAAARNVISGNNGSGIYLTGTGARDNVVQGNYIGTNAAGTAAVSNAEDGIIMLFGANDNQIGGTGAGAGNVVSGNAFSGIRVYASSDNNTIQGNYVGTNEAGTAAVGNGAAGVYVQTSGGTLVGGSAGGAGNVISGNATVGLAIVANTTTALGNLIGTNASGSAGVPNGGPGVTLAFANNTIGGPGAGAANVIAYNKGPGVIGYDPGTGNSIRGNSVLSNDGIGIDLQADGVTENDPGDTDGGANNRQNFPELTSVDSGGGDTTIEGTLNSAPNTSFVIDFYANAVCDPSAHGEGQTYVGLTTVTTDGSGNASFSEDFPTPSGDFFTATATDPSGNTSEFSACNPFPPLVVNSTGDGGDPNLVDHVCDDGTGKCTLRAAIQNGNATTPHATGTRQIQFAIESGAKSIKPSSALPAITKPVVIDGTTQPGYSGLPLIELNGASAGAFTDGLKLTGGDSTVRGLIIDRFGGDGIELSGAGGNVIAGNDVGTDASGAAGFGNGLDGVLVSGSSNNRIGGTAPADRNVISGNQARGVEVVGAAATGNTIQGNYIGVAPDGITGLGNSLDGVRLSGAPGNTVGGAAAGAGNVISANHLRGVLIQGSGSTGNAVAGNGIGTDAAGTGALGNASHGVLFSNGASGNAVGGTAPNTIAHNGGDGVFVSAGTENAVRSNSLYGNAGLGLDLGPDGVTPNDPGDSDTGPNGLQNFPILTFAGSGGGSTTVQGSLNSTPSSSFTVEFLSSPSCDGSGNGEGKVFLGSAAVATNGSGNASFDESFGTEVAQGDVVTATATDGSGNTSEFSACQVVGAQAPTISIDDVTVTEGNAGTTDATFTISLSSASAQTVTVDYATADGTAVAPSDYAAASGTLTFDPGDTSKQVTVRVNGDVLNETDETFFVNLSNPTNATIADGQGAGTIRNDDPTPTLSITDVTKAEGSGGVTTKFKFKVTLSAPSGLQVTVRVATANGTAVAPGDYKKKSRTITFAPGVTSKTFTVNVVGDNVLELDELFFVNLSNPTNATIADGQGVGTIQNDD